MNIKVKIAIPIVIIFLIVVGVLASSNFMVKKIIEVDAEASVMLKLNKNDKIVKVVAFDTNAENILENMDMEIKEPLKFVDTFVEKSEELEYLTEDSEINYLFASDDFSKDENLMLNISEQLSLNSDVKVNQYKVTKKDYSIINKIKSKVKYTSYEVIREGFDSVEEKPYITSVIYDNDSYFINFSKEVAFNGNEKVVCTYDSKMLDTAPAGYNKNSLAVFVIDAPSDVTLNFDVTIKDYSKLSGLCISPSDDELEDDFEVEVSIDNEINKEKLETIHEEIDSADIPDEDKAELLRQYDTLNNSINSLATQEELNDFNIMYQNLVDSLEAFTEEYVPEPTPTTSDKPKPTETQTPTTDTPVDYNKLNADYYNQLNQYKAMVLAIKDETTRNTINAEINQLYYKLSIATTKEDYDTYATNLSIFEEHLKPYMW